MSITTEKDILEHYFALQNKHFDDTIQFSIEIEEELIEKNILIPPMLAQPFIENSLKHARLEQIEDAKITVRFSKTNQYIKLSIEDNGIGIEKSLANNKEKSNHKSMAISITHERLKLMNQNKRVDLQIIDLSKIGRKGTKVELMIPISEKTTL